MDTTDDRDPLGIVEAAKARMELIKMEEAEEMAEIMRYTEIGYQNIYRLLFCALLLTITGQAIFFAFGTPPNLYSLVKIIRELRVVRNTGDCSANSWLLLLALHLIIADLLILILYCFGKTLWLATFFWYGGPVLCKIFLFCSTFGYYLWSYLVVTAAADMWYCTCFPLRSRRMGANRVKHWILICWLLATGFSVPQLIVWGQVEVPKNYTDGISDKAQCVFLYSGIGSFPRDYQIYHATTVFYIPLTGIVFVHVGLALTLFMKNNHSKGTHGHGLLKNSGGPSATGSMIASNQELHNRQSSKIFSSMSISRSFRGSSAAKIDQNGSSSSLKKAGTVDERRTTISSALRLSAPMRTSRTKRKSSLRFFKTTISVILTFTLTWLPYQIVALKRILCGPGPEFSADWNGCIDSLVNWEWLEGIMILGACLNPFIYRFRARVDRKSVKRNTTQRNSSINCMGGDTAPAAGGHYCHLMPAEISSRFRSILHRRSTSASSTDHRKGQGHIENQQQLLRQNVHKIQAAAGLSAPENGGGHNNGKYAYNPSPITNSDSNNKKDSSGEQQPQELCWTTPNHSFMGSGEYSLLSSTTNNIYEGSTWSTTPTPTKIFDGGSNRGELLGIGDTDTSRLLPVSPTFPSHSPSPSPSPCSSYGKAASADRQEYRKYSTTNKIGKLSKNTNNRHMDSDHHNRILYAKLSPQRDNDESIENLPVQEVPLQLLQGMGPMTAADQDNRGERGLNDLPHQGWKCKNASVCDHPHKEDHLTAKQSSENSSIAEELQKKKNSFPPLAQNLNGSAAAYSGSKAAAVPSILNTIFMIEHSTSVKI